MKFGQFYLLETPPGIDHSKVYHDAFDQWRLMDETGRDLARRAPLRPSSAGCELLFDHVIDPDNGCLSGRCDRSVDDRDGGDCSAFSRSRDRGRGLRDGRNHVKGKAAVRNRARIPGRGVSQQGYKSITQIRAKADFSHLTSNFVVSTFYMVNNPTNPSLQPKGGDYCDAGGNNPQWNCQEVDFFETNKNVVFQHTMHIGDGSSSAPQNYQISYSTTQDTCFTDLTPKQGLVSWGGIKLSDPVDIIIDLDSNGMTVLFHKTLFLQ